MRNRIQHASPFRWMLRRYIFLMVAVLLISFAVFPMQGMTRVMSVGRILSMRDPGEPITSSMMDSYIRELTLDFVYSPLNLEMLCLLFGGLGFGAALVLFRHLFSRKQGMMIAGLPMTRSKDFLLPLGLCLMIHPAVVWGNGLRAYFNLRMYLMRAGTTLLINLYGFALGALCASLFGTVWSAVLGGLLTAGSAELVMHGWIEIASMYLKTMFRDGTERAMFRFSPIYSMYKSFYRPDQFTPFLGLLVTAILLVLGWAANRRADAEYEAAGARAAGLGRSDGRYGRRGGAEHVPGPGDHSVSRSSAGRTGGLDDDPDAAGSADSAESSQMEDSGGRHRRPAAGAAVPARRLVRL